MNKVSHKPSERHSNDAKLTVPTVLLEKEVEGKVRFYGENLAATKNFATKVAGVVKANF